MPDLRLSDISTVKNILQKHGFSFSKSMGQNFLINPSVCPRMAESCTGDNIGVLEIGPGIGVLTRELASRAKKVVCIELDRSLEPILAETLADFSNIRIIFEDVMKINLKAILDEHFEGMQVVVCANLPYYITSPILMMLLESRLPLQSITVMVQKETARRMCAPVGSRESGAVTVAVHYYSQPEILFDVSRGSFMPAPNVDSSVIRLAVRKTPPVTVTSEKNFFKTVKAAFGMRRKTILNSMSAGLGIPKDTLAEKLNALGISPAERAEKLTLQQLAEISDAIY